MRNVVAPPQSGVCPDELFDVTPYLAAYVRYAVRHPLTQNFPRKFKTSFTGCTDHDDIISPLHDLAYIAQVRGEGADAQQGFKVLVGGGTSIMPKLGQTLYDFVSMEDYLRVATAIWRVFERADMLRKNRMMARIKVLIHRIGFDAFKVMVEEELEKVDPVDPRPLMALDQVYSESPPALVAAPSNGLELPKEFLYWKETNVTPQKQAGYLLVHVTVPQGDIEVDQFPALAEIVRKFTGGSARTTLEQNLALRWVPEGRLFDLWKALDDIGLAEPDAHGITNVVSCPGTDSCKLGITSSMGLGRAVREELLGNPSAYQGPRGQRNAREDQRLSQRMRPAPRGQHRLSRRCHEGAFRHADSGLRTVLGRAIRGRRLGRNRLWRTDPQGESSGQDGPPAGAYDCGALQGKSRVGREVQ